MTAGRLFDIKRFSTHDGPGIRTTVFLTGCPLACWWCHNPEALALHVPPGTHGAGEAAGPAPGRGFVGEFTTAQVLDEVLRDRPYYESSGGGVTFSGGEPFEQAGFLLELLRESRRNGLHTAVDTCGLAPADLVREAAAETDLFLYDFKLLDPAGHERYTGRTNDAILENLQLLDRLGARIWVRIPLVPGITATPENLSATARFLLDHVSCRRISLLPYHRAGTGKHERLGREYRLPDLAPPTADDIAAAREHFESKGFTVRIGA
jgi:pyruvate formate lyase activating enzyme